MVGDEQNEQQEENGIRAIVVHIPADTVLEMFQAGAGDRSFLAVPVFPELPKGYRIVAVHDDFMRNSFAFVIEHPEFPLVEPGTMYPVRPRPEIQMVQAFRRIEVESNGD